VRQESLRSSQSFSGPELVRRFAEYSFESADEVERGQPCLARSIADRDVRTSYVRKQIPGPAQLQEGSSIGPSVRSGDFAHVTATCLQRTTAVDIRGVSPGLGRAVRQTTQKFQDVNAATAAGYVSSASCASGPNLGAMGVHYVNETFIADGILGAPNRLRIPAHYELHVWAWKRNSSGIFSDWNPRVSCAQYTGE
jgi:hypothetical protein